MSKTAIIIGAGPAGLTAAYELLNRSDIKPIIIEENDFVGGISATLDYKNNKIDMGGHRFFSKSDRVMDWWLNILPLQGKPSKDDIILEREVELSKLENAPNPEETDKVIVDGWMLTGDLGYVKDGFIFLTGRAKNLIITDNGKNVYPEEIEDYLQRSEYIEECMVYAGDDNKIAAKIYPNFEAVEAKLGDGYTDEMLNNLISEEIKEINKNIPLYKAVAQFSIRKEEFIKTTTKKIKRAANM